MIGLLLLSATGHAATTLVVTSATDSHVAGRTTLREALAAANNGDAIEFSPTLFAGSSATTIKLTAQLVITKSLTVFGPGDASGTHIPRLRLEGSGQARILQVNAPATIVVAGITFSQGLGAGGGAVLIQSGATATFQGCDFVSNQATESNAGGAILNRGTLTLDQCLVAQNCACNGGGLATYGRLKVVRSLIDGNTATDAGGGIYSSAADLFIESSTIAYNKSGSGGAVSFFSSSYSVATATITAATVADNTSEAQAGGLYVEGSGAVAKVGGSIFTRNTIVPDRGAQTARDLATSKNGKINSADYNIVGKPGTTFSPYGAHDQVGIDPQTGPLAYEGGRTRTYSIAAGSPAIDHGDPAFLGSLAVTDQRLSPRVFPAGGRPDVGAFERGAVVTLTLIGDAAITLPLGRPFVDPGTNVSGPPQTIISKTVNGVLNGQVNPCCPGLYEIVYTATYGGYSTSVTRRVTISAAVVLAAPATVTRFIGLATGTATVNLAGIVTVTGLPLDGSCAPQYAVTVTPSGINQTGLASLPNYTLGQVGDYVVAVKAFSQCGTQLAAVTFKLVIDYGNVAWPLAIDLDSRLVPSGGKLVGTIRQMISRPGEARWYKFKGMPGSRIEVTLTELPGNFDLVVYSDINQAYNQLLGQIAPASSAADKKLALLGAQFAPEAYSPEAYSPEAYSPEAYSPEAYSPEAYSPEAYSPAVYTPEAYSPEAYSPEAYSPEAYSPEAYSPEAYSPEAYSPEAYASAQQQTLVAFSASPGTVSEGIRFNTYSKSGEFYIRVRGQNGVYSTAAPFALTVAVQQDLCSGVTNLATTPSTTAPAVTGAPASLILWDSVRIAGTAAEKTALAAALATFATAANGVVVDLNGDSQIRDLQKQANDNPFCPVAKNLVAEAIRNLIRLYRKAAPSIADISLVGNDDVIPFFRTADDALLASEANYFPPVRDDTQSQSSLRSAQVLSQDRYGSSAQVNLATGPYDLPDLPVGRLVETANEVTLYLNAYRALFNGSVGTGGVVPTPNSGFVAGYDFLADAAIAMRDDFSAGLGGGATVDTLISPVELPPALGWTADQLRAAFLGKRHDLSFLGGHFSTSRALAADYSTRMRAKEVADSTINLMYALILSAGCHSGYGTVDKDALPLTEQPDWAQAFARKNAIWISGTGYQYGDTDFVEYTERLVLEVSRALRTGPGPIGIGRAFVEAKRRYLADTSVMRGIHEKTLLELTLYGLPMVKFNLPGTRLVKQTPAASVSTPVAVTTGAGVAHALKTGVLSFNSALTRVDKTFNVVGTTATIVASYFRGANGQVSIPGEPVRPLLSFNVSRPEGFVRGVGFRAGTYVDLAGFAPFTGAPATETRGVHGEFSTEVFYPVRPWSLNQTGELADASGISALNTFPTQFLSDGPDAPRGTLRRFDQMQFNVFYCPEVSEAALANPPAINIVASTLSPTAVTFSVEAAATVGAGIQEVWVTYTGLAGSPFYGQWQSFTLTRPANVASGIGTWTGSLPLNGADPTKVRFFVQAVNGIGAAAANTNFGRYFLLGTSTLDGIGTVGSPTSLVFVAPVPTSGFYRATIPLQARLTGVGPLAGKRIQFRIGSVTRSVQTDANGAASTTLLVNALPGPLTLEANFAGDATYQSSSTTRPFTLLKMPTRLTFDSPPVVSDTSGIAVTLRAQDGTPLRERTVVFLLESGSFRTSVAEITNGFGQARLASGLAGARTYLVSAYFAVPVVFLDGSVVPLSDALYEGSTASTTIQVSPSR